MSGIRVGSIAQVDEGYCDDINVLVDNAEDIDEAFRKFEEMSAAIFFPGIISQKFWLLVLGM